MYVRMLKHGLHCVRVVRRAVLYAATSLSSVFGVMPSHVAEPKTGWKLYINYRNICKDYTVTCMVFCVTCRTGFGLAVWIYWRLMARAHPGNW